MGPYRIASLIITNPFVIYMYFYTYQYFCHNSLKIKLVFLANQLISRESSKELYGQKLENHKDDSDLFPLQYNHNIKSIGLPITTKVIGQSTAESMSKCVVTFRNLKKAYDRDPTNRLRLYLGSICKRQTTIKIVNHFISCLYILRLFDQRSIFFYPVYIHTKTCDSRHKLLKSILRV